MAENERNRRWVRKGNVQPVLAHPSASVPSNDSDSDSDYDDAATSFQYRSSSRVLEDDRGPRDERILGYASPALRTFSVPEAAYSQVQFGEGRGKSCRRMFCTGGNLAVVITVASVVLNVLMCATAMLVIVSVTSPESDVICTLVRSLLCSSDANCTFLSASVANISTLRSIVHQEVNESIRSFSIGAIDNNNNVLRRAVDQPVRLQCAAHLFLDYSNSARASCAGDRFQKLTNWTYGGNHAFQRDCITSNDRLGEVHVRDGGFYIFYDHLAVCRCGTNSGFRQRVIRRSRNGSRETLLEETSPSWPSGEDDSCRGEAAFASDLFATVRLEQQDTVLIEVKPASAVYRPNSASFFGLYRLV